MFAGEAAIVDRILVEREMCQFASLLGKVCTSTYRSERAPPIDLRGDDQIIAFPAELLYSNAHNFFRLPTGVSLSAIEEVDPGIESGFHTVKCNFCSRSEAIRFEETV